MECALMFNDWHELFVNMFGRRSSINKYLYVKNQPYELAFSFLFSVNILYMALGINKLGLKIKTDLYLILFSLSCLKQRTANKSVVFYY